MPKFYSTPLVDDGDGHFDREHTPAHPYCGNQSCWCHYNVSYHAQVQYPTNQTCEECGTSHAHLVVIFQTLLCQSCALRVIHELQQQVEVQR
jgi:hypothetical protein